MDVEDEGMDAEDKGMDAEDEGIGEQGDTNTHTEVDNLVEESEIQKSDNGLLGNETNAVIETSTSPFDAENYKVEEEEEREDKEMEERRALDKSFSKELALKERQAERKATEEKKLHELQEAEKQRNKELLPAFVVENKLGHISANKKTTVEHQTKVASDDVASLGNDPRNSSAHENSSTHDLSSDGFPFALKKTYIDAHYAGMVLFYLETDLPWDKLTAWLKEKKTTFRNTPPSWLTIEWLNLLPKDVRDAVWDNAQFRELTYRIREVEDRFKQGYKRLKTKDRKASTTVEDSYVGASLNMKPNKYLDKNNKMKIHPKNGNDLNNFSANESSLPDNPKLLRKREDVMKEKNNDGRNCEVMPEKDHNSSPNIISNNGPEEGHEDEEDERTKAIRKEVAEHMQRRSSLGGSVFASKEARKVEEEGIPSVLKELFEKAETMQMDEIREASKEAVDGELFAILLGPEKDATGEDIMLIILKGFLRQRNKQVEKNNINEGVPRILLAAFFELVDEVSDIILAGLFYADDDNKQWAGHLMFVFMGLSRLMQALFSLSMGESKWRVCEGFIGIKCITDNYRIIRDGPLALSGGNSLVSIRAFSLGFGMTCESLPQMMLQVFIVLSAFKKKNFETGILIAQAISVMFSCISIGLSLASVYVDSALPRTIPGKEKHKSSFKFLPRDNKFRQTVILVSMTMIKASHLLLAIFGFGALFSYAPIPG
eukprot:g4221.t1